MPLSPRLAAALRELNEAVAAEVDEALALIDARQTKPRDDLAQRVAMGAIDSLKRKGLIPTSYNPKASKR